MTKRKAIRTKKLCPKYANKKILFSLSFEFGFSEKMGHGWEIIKATVDSDRSCLAELACSEPQLSGGDLNGGLS